MKPGEDARMGSAGQGIVKINVEPFPSADSTHIRPPWRSTIRLQIARPTPVPACIPVVPQPLERFKDAVMILRINSDAVIVHTEHPLARFAFTGYVYLRRSFI